MLNKTTKLPCNLVISPLACICLFFFFIVGTKYLSEKKKNSSREGCINWAHSSEDSAYDGGEGVEEQLAWPQADGARDSAAE